jgi:hypothetical protein
MMAQIHALCKIVACGGVWWRSGEFISDNIRPAACVNKPCYVLNKSMDQTTILVTS